MAGPRLPNQQITLYRRYRLQDSGKKFLADDISNSFSYFFPRKQVLTFHANCLQWTQFALKISISGENKKKKKKIKTNHKLSSVEFAQRVTVVKVNATLFYPCTHWVLHEVSRFFFLRKYYYHYYNC